MAVKEIISSRSYRVNLGDYQSVELFTSMRAEHDESFDGTAKEASARLARDVEESSMEQLRAVYKARGQHPTDDEIRKRHGIPR